jgi:hypothetical protein
MTRVALSRRRPGRYIGLDWLDGDSRTAGLIRIEATLDIATVVGTALGPCDASCLSSGSRARRYAAARV